MPDTFTVLLICVFIASVVVFAVIARLLHSDKKNLQVWGMSLVAPAVAGIIVFYLYLFTLGSLFWAIAAFVGILIHAVIAMRSSAT